MNQQAVQDILDRIDRLDADDREVLSQRLAAQAQRISLASSLATIDASMADIREGRTQSAKELLSQIATELGVRIPR